MNSNRKQEKIQDVKSKENDVYTKNIQHKEKEKRSLSSRLRFYLMYDVCIWFEWTDDGER